MRKKDLQNFNKKEKLKIEKSELSNKKIPKKKMINSILSLFITQSDT